MNLPTTTRAPVHVAVGVIRDGEGHILIARRAAHLHQGGLWEFPGGKVEKGESVIQALARELREELDLTPLATKPLLRIHHHYSNKTVLLDVHEVTQFSGEARGLQQQPLRWVSVPELVQYEFPAANCAIVNALRLSRIMLVTGSWRDHHDFEQRLNHALQQGVRLVQLRAPSLAFSEFAAVCALAKQLCERVGAQLLVNTTSENFASLHADGLHLSSTELRRCQQRPVARDNFFGASCHSIEELQHALAVEVDYVVLGHVCDTKSHPGVAPLGLEKFAQLATCVNVPVFAIGGMTPAMLPEINAHGGFGIAAISVLWNDAGKEDIHGS